MIRFSPIRWFSFQSGQSERTFPTPWTVWEGLAALAVFLLAQVGVSVLLAVMLAESWEKNQTEFSAKLALVLPVAVGVSHLAAWAMVYVLYLRRRMWVGMAGGFWKSLGLGRGMALPFAPGRMFLAGGLLQIGLAPVQVIFPPPVDKSPLEQFLANGPWSVAFMFAAAVVLAPLLEEVLFRGPLFTGLRRHMGFVPSALGTTGLFALMHLKQTGDYWPAVGVIFLCGWVLAWLREAGGGLWLPVVFHTGFNLAAFLVAPFFPEAGP
ncbi:MAG: CPBP family intramembrane metalloprotease [Deltaproteobacteria bacterium]|nr:CPBP family intramembrane metalloprotease [Deltaproteobacteria bacterium]